MALSQPQCQEDGWFVDPPSSRRRPDALQSLDQAPRPSPSVSPHGDNIARLDERLSQLSGYLPFKSSGWKVFLVAVLVCGLAVSATLSSLWYGYVSSQRRQAVVSSLGNVRSILGTSLERDNDLLTTVNALVATHPQLTNRSLTAVLSRLGLSQYYPGSVAFAYLEPRRARRGSRASKPLPTVTLRWACPTAAGYGSHKVARPTTACRASPMSRGFLKTPSSSGCSWPGRVHISHRASTTAPRLRSPDRSRPPPARAVLLWHRSRLCCARTRLFPRHPASSTPSSRSYRSSSRSVPCTSGRSRRLPRAPSRSPRRLDNGHLRHDRDLETSFGERERRLSWCSSTPHLEPRQASLPRAGAPRPALPCGS